jgi:hypothetical protein
VSESANVKSNRENALATTRCLYFLGRTKWELARNVVGIIFLLGVAVAWYVKSVPDRPAVIKRIVRVEIPESEHHLKSIDDFQKRFSTYNSLDQDLAAVALELKETPSQIKMLVNIDLDFRANGKFLVECESSLAQEAVEKVCFAAAESVGKHLRLNIAK